MVFLRQKELDVFTIQFYIKINILIFIILLVILLMLLILIKDEMNTGRLLVQKVLTLV